jgi:predicted regulator of Ras-like GTPase activity (Roadblock/LC7/MglB family)
MISEEEVQQILLSLKNVKGVHGAAIIEKFGDVTGSALPGWVDQEAVSAMVALMLKASQRATKELNQGKFLNAFIESEQGRLLFAPVVDDILVVIATKDVKLGVVNLKLETALEKFRGV